MATTLQQSIEKAKSSGTGIWVVWVYKDGYSIERARFIKDAIGMSNNPECMAVIRNGVVMIERKQEQPAPVVEVEMVVVSPVLPKLNETEVIVLTLLSDAPLLGREISLMTGVYAPYERLFWNGYIDSINGSTLLMNCAFSLSDKGRATLRAMGVA